MRLFSLLSSQSKYLSGRARPHWRVMFALLLLSLGLMAFGVMPVIGVEPVQARLPLAHVLMAGQKYTLEVAATPGEAERGLMYRTRLPENSGMLFQFKETRPVAFWMKNTLIPLDMLFIQSSQVVNIAHQAQPCREEPCAVYPSQVPVDMVIELPGGTARKNHIQTGTRLQWLPTEKHLKSDLTSAATNRKDL